MVGWSMGTAYGGKKRTGVSDERPIGAAGLNKQSPPSSAHSVFGSGNIPTPTPAHVQNLGRT